MKLRSTILLSFVFLACKGNVVDANCHDTEGWYDIEGPQFDCSFYKKKHNCEYYGDSYENFNQTANKACCSCGGGITTTQPPTTNSPTPGPSSTPEPTTDLPTWMQVGQDIDGENPLDQLGYSVSMSTSGHVIAVGAPSYYTDGHNYNPGSARIYCYNSNSKLWEQLGQTLFGEDEFGSAVSLSSDDGTIVAVGARQHNEKGSVYVYEYNTSSNLWEQLGEVLNGEAEYDEFGYAVKLSSNGNIVAVGARQGARAFSSPTGNGYVKFYQCNKGSLSWEQLGQKLEGKASGDYFGSSLSLSDDGHIAAVGAHSHSDDMWRFWVGYVEIFRYDVVADQWNYHGNNDLVGENSGDKFGDAVSISSRGNIVAAGAPGAEYLSGVIKILQLNEETSDWEQLGQSIFGESSLDQSGEFQSVSLSNNGLTVAIGSPYNNGNGFFAGSTRIFQYDSYTALWMQVGEDITGEMLYDYSGRSISVNGDGTMVVIGAADNSGPNTVDTRNGHVRIYSNRSV